MLPSARSYAQMLHYSVPEITPDEIWEYERLAIRRRYLEIEKARPEAIEPKGKKDLDHEIDECEKEKDEITTKVLKPGDKEKIETIQSLWRERRDLAVQQDKTVDMRFDPSRSFRHFRNQRIFNIDRIKKLFRLRVGRYFGHPSRSHRIFWGIAFAIYFILGIYSLFF